MSRARCPTCGNETRAEGLTKREQDVLDLLATGKRPVSIAVDLGISEYTVRCHIDHIRTQLGVHGVFDLARFELARRYEMLETDLRERHPDRLATLKAFCEYAEGKKR